ncbi:MAG: leucyl/phenylalanyl-tRNA--protein transferase [Phycisphaerae bacterium]|nr:leucyl/phenylalanyl-tRNA--protein transferase [Phycisphaerae bacterium]
MSDRRLEPEALLAFYRAGAFPMGQPGTTRVEFFTCATRAILPLDTFHAPRDAKRALERGVFTVTFDRDFDAVIRGCAEPRTSDAETWITAPIIEAYSRLHRCGHAHSVETWRDQRLVGGLYGVSIGAAFFGESMFSRLDDGGSNASSAALSALVERLRERGFTLFDCQYLNDHTRRLGAIEISERDYLARLADAVAVPDRW